MRQIIVCPELNYWMRKTLKNSPVTDTYHRIPSDISDIWRDTRSVLELMFNENFQPEPTPSSSSSYFPDQNLEAANDRPYIYLYRKCDTLLIPDKNVEKRLQLYRYNAQVYVVNAQKYADVIDTSGDTFVRQLNGTIRESSEIIEPAPPKDWTWIDRSSATAVLPKDVLEKDRSPYITYKTKIYDAGSFPQVDERGVGAIPGPYPPPPIYPDSMNIFGFTTQDLMMLDLLYLYKTNQPVSIDNIDFNSLTCIAKLVYIYLDAFLNNNFGYYSDEEIISTGSSILCTLYEKFVLDIIYSLIMEQYGVIWKESDVVNTERVMINADQFMIMKKANERILVTNEIYEAGEIVIKDRIFWDRKDFLIYKDGDLLENDKDYTCVVDFTDPNNPVARVHLISEEILPGQLLELIWSYVSPYSAYTQADV